MSTIKADNIATLAGVSTSMANAVNGSAKAWVNFNGTGTIAIRGSYNVSSLTDNGTGNYTVNFTNAMPDVNYSVASLCSQTGATNANIMGTLETAGNPAVGSIRILNARAAGAIDPAYVFATIFA